MRVAFFIFVVSLILFGCGGGGGSGGTTVVSGPGGDTPVSSAGSRLSASSSSLSSKASIGGRVFPPIDDAITITGIVTYDYVPSKEAPLYDKNQRYIGQRLDGWNISHRFADTAKWVTVQVQDSSGKVLSESYTDEVGKFKISSPKNTNVRIVALAEIFRRGTDEPAITFSVVDSMQGSLGKRPVHAFKGELALTKDVDEVRNLYAEYKDTLLGDPVSVFDGTPFAILNNARKVFKKWSDTGLFTQFPQLTVEWNIAQVFEPLAYYGNLESTIYLSSYARAYAPAGTPSFDNIMSPQNLAHEMGHYFMDHFSRMSKIGSSHAENANMVSIFDESIANAISQVTLNTELMYFQSLEFKDGLLNFGFGYGATDDFKTDARGVFREYNASYAIQSALRGDVDTLLRVVMSDGYKSSKAVPSIYLFQDVLSSLDPVKGGELRRQMDNLNIKGTGAWGDDESFFNSTGYPSEVTPYVLPFVVDLSVGVPTKVCTAKSGPSTREDASNVRFLRFQVPSQGVVSFSVKKSSSDSKAPIPSLRFDMPTGGAYNYQSQPAGANNWTLSRINLQRAGTYSAYFIGETAEQNLSAEGLQVNCYDVTVSFSSQ